MDEHGGPRPQERPTRTSPPSAGPAGHHPTLKENSAYRKEGPQPANRPGTGGRHPSHRRPLPSGPLTPASPQTSVTSQGRSRRGEPPVQRLIDHKAPAPGRASLTHPKARAPSPHAMPKTPYPSTRSRSVRTCGRCDKSSASNKPYELPGASVRVRESARIPTPELRPAFGRISGQSGLPPHPSWSRAARPAPGRGLTPAPAEVDTTPVRKRRLPRCRTGGRQQRVPAAPTALARGRGPQPPQPTPPIGRFARALPCGGRGTNQTHTDARRRSLLAQVSQRATRQRVDAQAAGGGARHSAVHGPISSAEAGPPAMMQVACPEGPTSVRRSRQAGCRCLTSPGT